jgi:hypothetical protein
MLDAWIIDRLKRQEQKRAERPALQVPAPAPLPPRPRERHEDDVDERGSTAIDYAV